MYYIYFFIIFKGLSVAKNYLRPENAPLNINPEPQLLPYTPACGYKFHTLSIYLHPTFTVPQIRGAFGIQSNICGGVFLRK